jgi:hypothetical protein
MLFQHSVPSSWLLLTSALLCASRYGGAGVTRVCGGEELRQWLQHEAGAAGSAVCDAMAELGITDLARLGAAGLGEAEVKRLGLPMKVRKQLVKALAKLKEELEFEFEHEDVANVGDPPPMFEVVDSFITEEEVDTLLKLAAHGDYGTQKMTTSTLFYKEYTIDDMAAAPALGHFETKVVEWTHTNLGRNWSDTSGAQVSVDPGHSALGVSSSSLVHLDKTKRPQSVVTSIVFLTTVEETAGGHTVFPCLPPLSARQVCVSITFLSKHAYSFWPC